MTPRRAGAHEDFGAILALIRDSFAYMDGLIDPPSSMHRLGVADVARQATNGEVWVIGPPGAPLACVFLTPKPDALYIGKLAVAAGVRGRGHGRMMIDLAGERARARGLPVLELQTRVELTGNQRFFTSLGFAEVARTAHPGYDHPTSITYRRAVG